MAGLLVYALSIGCDILSDQGVFSLPRLNEWGFVLFLFFYAKYL